MARTRQIKPDFNDHDDIAALSFAARVLYICLWGHLDRQGLIEDSPRSIRSKVFPREDHTTADIETWRDELLRPGPSGRARLVRLTWRGKTLLYCPTLTRHNRIYSDEPGQYDVPESLLEQARQEAGIDAPPTTPAVDPPKSPGGTRAGPARDPRVSPGSPSASAPASQEASASTSAPASAALSGTAARDRAPEARAGSERLTSGGSGSGAGPPGRGLTNLASVIGRFEHRGGNRGAG